MADQKLEPLDRIYNIKGLSWMLKSSTATSSLCSTNSSHIDQQFKIFKLKDEKKKWKKKINKKFQSVGEQIKSKIKHRYSSKQPFDINYKKQPDIKHTPHLRQVKSVILTNSPFIQQSKSLLIEKNKSIMEQKQIPKSLYQKENNFSSNNSRLSSFIDSKEQQNNIMKLKKVFGELKNENQKVLKSKNILKLHSKQKAFIDKHNEQFFGKERQWINNKVQFYNQFDIKQYERELIQKRCIDKN